MLLTLGRLLREFARLEARVTEFMAHFERTVASFDRASFRGKSLDELLALTHRLRVELMEKWEAPILNDFFVMMAFGSASESARSDRARPGGALWNALVSGEEGIRIDRTDPRAASAWPSACASGRSSRRSPVKGEPTKRSRAFGKQTPSSRRRSIGTSIATATVRWAS